MTSSQTPSDRLSDAAYRDAFHLAPVALLVVQADGLIMLDANRPYLDAVGMSLGDIAGRHVFDVFPNSPFNADDQATDLAALFTRTVETGERQVVDSLRYDIPDGEGGFDVRWWSVTETPLVAKDGRTELVLHYTEDITELIRARENLAATEAARDLSVARVAALAELALALASVESIPELEQIVTSRGLAAIGAEGGAIVSGTDDQRWRVTTSEWSRPGDELVLDRDNPLPGIRTANTGERIVLRDRAESVAFAPDMQQVNERTGAQAYVVVPLIVAGEVLGSLTVAWSEPHDPPAEDLEIIDGFAAQCAQALHRVQLADARRRDAAQNAVIAGALQQALLTPPPVTDGVEVAVRYRPAIDAAQVGGDWYDAFVDPRGAVTAVIGDVMGHDTAAAAAMGQLRGLLRGVAYAANDAAGDVSPAAIVHAWERSARGLGVDCLATAVLARLDPAEGGDGRRTLHWSNAGHLPPMLLAADGQVTMLDEKADLLLGFDADAPRTDHSVTVGPGATVFFYTDGLVERRTESIDTGLDDLSAALSGFATAPVDDLCDGVLSELAPHMGEDDVAVIALRVGG